MGLLIPSGASRDRGELCRRVECAVEGPRDGRGRPLLDELVDVDGEVRLRAEVLGVQPATVLIDVTDGVITVSVSGRRRRRRRRARTACAPRGEPARSLRRSACPRHPWTPKEKA